jgi:hypothetical protein
MPQAPGQGQPDQQIAAQEKLDERQRAGQIVNRQAAQEGKGIVNAHSRGDSLDSQKAKLIFVIYWTLAKITLTT